MSTTMLSLLTSFIPFLLLFVIACEIFFRSPKSQFHQMTALLLLFLSFLFFADYQSSILPREQAHYFTLVMKYCNAFILMSFSIYFFKKISNVSFHGLADYLFLVPLFGILLILLFPSVFTFKIIETETGRYDTFSVPFIILLMMGSIYSVFWTVFFLLRGNKKAKSNESSELYKRRLFFITKGCIYTILSISLSVFIATIGGFFGISLTFIAPYGVFVLAYTIRYSMIHLEWLTTHGHKYELVYKISSNGILLVNENGTILDVNPAFCKMIQSGKITMIGKNFSNYIHKKDRASFLAKFNSKSVTSLENLELTILAKNNYYIDVELLTQNVEIDDKKLIYIMLRDITNQKLYEQRLRYLAFHDPLTGLGNRTAFHEKAITLFEKAKEENTIVAIVLIDLDKFKWVNDTYGHLAGDHLLIHVGKQILKSIPENAHASRMGGDEFALLIPEVSKDSISPYVEQLLTNITKKTKIDSIEYSVTGSIGVSIAHKDGSDTDTLMKLADKAMYFAKENGKNNYCFYSPLVEK